MGKTELIPSLCGDTLIQQPVGDEGGFYRYAVIFLGEGNYISWGRLTEYRTEEEIRGWGLLTESHLTPFLSLMLGKRDRPSCSTGQPTVPCNQCVKAGRELDSSSFHDS